jgi:hypothetical protein
MPRVKVLQGQMCRTCDGFYSNARCHTFIDFGIEVAPRIRFGASKGRKAQPVGEFRTISELSSTIRVPVGKITDRATGGTKIRTNFRDAR